MWPRWTLRAASWLVTRAWRTRRLIRSTCEEPWLREVEGEGVGDRELDGEERKDV